MVFDTSLKGITNGITGANKKDTHYTGVNPGRDFTITEEADITIAEEGDLCPQCGKAMITRKGIEVGHIFKLGYKYSKSMSLTVLDRNGKAVHPIMGCYGIGVNRTMAAVVEQHHDDKGIVWPMTITPFQVCIVGIAKSDEETAAVDEIYTMVKDAGIEVLLDDRKVSPGFKFADAELIGIPIRITVGKNYFNNNELEIKMRRTGESENVTKGNLLARIMEIIKQETDIIEK